jgi:glycosyltransferase involved in cell wall biosynthesis
VRIAIEASTWVNPRGFGRFTRELTRALLRSGTPHTFTLVVDSGAAAASDLPDAPVVTVPTGRAVAEAASADSSRSIPDVLRIARRLSSGFDAVLFPTSFSFVPVAPGPLVAVVIHDAMPEIMPELVGPSVTARALWNLKSRLVRWRADLIATVSNASADAISRTLHVARERIAVLTEGASPEFSPDPGPDDETLVRSAVRGDAPYILYVGGLSPHKRVPELIRAFGRVATDSHYSRVRLVLVGPGEQDTFVADRGGVGAALSAIGPAADRVVQTGYVDDRTLAALYRRASVAVLPSKMEGFGLPALEAMASGTPLIVARNPALEEVCGDAAEYVGDVCELSGALQQLLADSGRRSRLRRAGLERATHFGWDQAASRLLQALDRPPSR